MIFVSVSNFLFFQAREIFSEGTLKDENEIHALLLYTYDHGFGQEGNIYFEMNNVLIVRDENRPERLKPWRTFFYYMMSALGHIPTYQGNVFRCLPSMLKTAREIYTPGKEIQWSSFTSTSTSLDAVKKSFGKDKTQDIIFKILVSNGKTLHPYSCVPERGRDSACPKSRELAGCWRLLTVRVWRRPLLPTEPSWRFN